MGFPKTEYGGAFVGVTRRQSVEETMRVRFCRYRPGCPTGDGGGKRENARLIRDRRSGSSIQVKNNSAAENLPSRARTKLISAGQAITYKYLTGVLPQLATIRIRVSPLNFIAVHTPGYTKRVCVSNEAHVLNYVARASGP